jgi:GAF domain-containing protein
VAGDTPDVTAALAKAARTINRPTSVTETLTAIARAARATVAGFDQVGISLVHSDGIIETRAWTGDLVPLLDALQYELEEGPCFSSLHEEPVIVVDHIKDSQRWPRFVPKAVRLGLKAQMGLRLYVDEEGTIGSLNLYSTRGEDIDPHAVHIAELFAAQAAAALGRAQYEDQLTDALLTRQVIGQAVGIVIERYSIDEHDAFRCLVRMSQETQTNVRILAERVVAEAINNAVRR